MEAFDNVVKKYTTWLDNPYVAGALTVFLVVYAAAAAPKLPSYMVKMFDYTLVKLVMFFLIIFLSRKNATVALIAAIALMVSIMTLNRLKFDQEMMSVVNNEEKANRRFNMGSCSCTCGEFEEILPQSDDGKLVAAEAQKAVAVGALPQIKATELIKAIANAESEGKAVLVAKTEEGAKRMEEINQLVKVGAVGAEEAKKKEAVVVVAEAVMEAKKEASVAIVAPKNTNSTVSPTVKMAEMAQEVLKRKQEETTKRGGVSPTNEELQQMCANVLDDYRKSTKSSSCSGSSCSRSSNSVNSDEDSDISGVDPTATSYASVESQ